MKNKKLLMMLLSICVMLTCLVACQNDPAKNDSNPTPTIEATSTPIVTATSTPTLEPTPTNMPTPTNVPTPTNTPTLEPNNTFQVLKADICPHGRELHNYSEHENCIHTYDGIYSDNSHCQCVLCGVTLACFDGTKFTTTTGSVTETYIDYIESWYDGPESIIPSEPMPTPTSTPTPTATNTPTPIPESTSSDESFSGLIPYGEDWKKLMDLPVKLPEDGTILFSNNPVYKWDNDNKQYTINEEFIKSRLLDDYNEDINNIFSFGLTDASLWGICVGESYPYLYTEGADNYGSVEVLTDDFDVCVQYCNPFKVAPIAHSDLLMLKSGDNFIPSYDSTYVLIFNGATIDDCIYKIPLTDVCRYMKENRVESYIENVSASAEDIFDSGLLVGKNVTISWDAIGYPSVTSITIYNPDGFKHTIDISDIVKNNSVTLQFLHCDNGVYKFELVGLYAYAEVEYNIADVLSQREFLDATSEQDSSASNSVFTDEAGNELRVMVDNINYDVEVPFFSVDSLFNKDFSRASEKLEYLYEESSFIIKVLRILSLETLGEDSLDWQHYYFWEVELNNEVYYMTFLICVDANEEEYLYTTFWNTLFN